MSFFDIFRQKKSVKKIDSPLNLVVDAAGLVSNPDKIDLELDRVREITSKLGDNQAPSEADNKVLLQVYLTIENFLIEKEKARIFTKDELRQRLSQRLQTRLKNIENAAK